MLCVLTGGSTGLPFTSVYFAQVARTHGAEIPEMPERQRKDSHTLKQVVKLQQQKVNGLRIDRFHSCSSCEFGSQCSESVWRW